MRLLAGIEKTAFCFPTGQQENRFFPFCFVLYTQIILYANPYIIHYFFCFVKQKFHANTRFCMFYRYFHQFKIDFCMNSMPSTAYLTHFCKKCVSFCKDSAFRYKPILVATFSKICYDENTKRRRIIS